MERHFGVSLQCQLYRAAAGAVLAEAPSGGVVSGSARRTVLKWHLHRNGPGPGSIWLAMVSKRTCTRTCIRFGPKFRARGLLPAAQGHPAPCDRTACATRRRLPEFLIQSGDAGSSWGERGLLWPASGGGRKPSPLEREGCCSQIEYLGVTNY